MKTILLPLLIAVMLVSSCTVERRLYRPGLHVEFLKSHSTKAEHMNVFAAKKQKEERRFSLISPVIEKNILATHTGSKPEPKREAPVADTLIKDSTEIQISDPETREQVYQSSKPSAQEKIEIKTERNRRTAQHIFLAIVVGLLTYFHIWIPAFLLCLGLVALMHNRIDPLVTIRKRAAKKALQTQEIEYAKAEEEFVQIKETKAPVNNKYYRKKQVHAGGPVSLLFVILWPLSIIGLCLSVDALADIKNQPDRYKGKGVATVGLVLTSIITFFLVLVLFAAVL